jgi:hypothetical protein
MAPQASQPPQSFSLNDLLRQHCRDRLYVQPLHWTAQHLQLLGCRFVRRPHRSPASSTQVDKRPPKHEQDTDLEYAVRLLVYSRSITDKRAGLIDLLHALSNDPIITTLPYVTPFPSPYLKNQLLIHRRRHLDLYYAGRPVARLPCRVFGRVIDDIPTPFLVYVDYSEEVASSRENSIPTPSCNPPVWRIRKATRARLQPAKTHQDPYLASILIALAQARQFAHSHRVRLYLRPLARKHLLIKKQVHLLVTNSGFIRVYTATITAAFLCKLDHPSLFSDSSFIIRYTNTPISNVKQEIATILEPLRRKKRPRELVTTEQRACKKKKELGDGSRGKR